MNSDTVDLIYLDPPFNSKKNYAAPIGSKAAGASFTDTWSLDDVKREWVEDLQSDNTATWSAITAAGYIHGESSQAYLTYMAIRLLEMRRILKPTGSIYLHCDPTMSHYLKTLMDAIFGRRNFRNEIVWSYNRFSRRGKAFPSMHDVILFYAMSSKSTFNVLHTAPRGGGGQYARGYHTVVDGGTKKLLVYDPAKVKAAQIDLSKYDKVVPTKARRPRMGSDWTDISIINPMAKERTGYPTQKPLKLLERIIQASSSPGDTILDPFCGCATTCVAAEKYGRQWVGIDVEEKARELVVDRLREEVYRMGFLEGAQSLKGMPQIHHLQRPPKRTDPDAPRRSKNIKRVLYGLQNGRCKGVCGERRLDIDLFEIDHIRPRSKGGTDTDENLQLLCPTCNRRKGSKAMARFLELMEV